ncbi:nuclear transport factor 2 family protein [Actinomyces gerencseriae]|uniref:nuclear transport factor 2 family protein n=1 Tax=Actinomyces gerencseriae TaxID=52769 RepID=UPI0028E26363|nr:nuclear transport factor 2 family protein [Actinomyces gerencseriae]
MTDKNVWDRLSNGDDVSLFEQDYTDIVRVEFSRCRDLIFSGAMSTVKTAYHFNGQQVITIDGDTATDVHYGKAILVQEQDGKDALVDNSIRYTDTLVLVDGTWLISRREQHVVITETRPL